ncbi:MAG: hypothetical protein EOP53_12540 [Sphingobacteriales bacterium]|nr:MAG: hypothetical protein EOP53_12540 [Sphingobacteriales bacterium]
MRILKLSLGAILICISFLSCENISTNASDISNQDSIIDYSGDEFQTCFYQKNSASIDKTFPFSVADKIEVVSHLPPFSAQKIKSKNDSIQIDNYTIFGIKERIKLKKEQTDSLFSILYNFTNKSNTQRTMDCDDPRHAVIFYAKSKPIAYIDICIECSQVHYPKQMEIPVFCDEKWKMLESYFKSIGIKSGFMDTNTGRVNDFAEDQDVIQFVTPAIKE